MARIERKPKKISLLQKLALSPTLRSFERALVGQSRLSAHEEKGIQRTWMRLECMESRPNLFITLTAPLPYHVVNLFDPVIGQGDEIDLVAAQKLTHQVEDFIFQLGRTLSKGALSRANPESWFRFYAFFECEASDASGTVAPHFHCTFRFTDALLSEFKDGAEAKRLWHRLMKSSDDTLFHCDIGRNDRAVTYCTKTAGDQYAARFLVNNKNHRFLKSR